MTIETGAEAVIKAVLQGLGRFPLELNIGGELTIRIGIHDDGPDDPAWPTVRTEVDSARMIVRCGSSVLTLSFAEDQAWLILPKT